MNIPIPTLTIPSQTIKQASKIITFAPKTVTVQPEPLEVNGAIIPQLAQSFSVQLDPVTITFDEIVIPSQTIPGYTITVADPTTVPVIPTMLYSATSVWNTKLSPTAPLHANSVGYVAEITKINRLHNAWLNVGTPVYFVTNADAKVPIYLTNTTNAASPVGIELAAGINIPKKLIGSQVDSDKSCCIINLDTKKEYNIWKLTWNATLSRYEGISAGILSNYDTSDGTFARLAYWNSVRAGHTTLGAGMNLKKELDNKLFPHVGALVLGRTKPATWVYPCKSSDGIFADANSIPYGTHFRFPANIVINPAWSDLTKALVVQGRDYGFIVVDQTGWGNVIAFEGFAQYGVADDYAYIKTFSNNKELWDIMGTTNTDTEFPWTQLQAIA